MLIGKSLFMRYLAGEWSKEDSRLAYDFDLVVLVKLRDYIHPDVVGSKLPPLKEILRFLLGCYDGEVFIECKPSRILYLVDGYDEVYLNPSVNKFLRSIMENSVLVITTRPFTSSG